MAFLVYLLFWKAPSAIAVVYGFGVYQFIRIKFFMHGMLHFRHFSSHGKLFRSTVANWLPNLYLDPFMGIPPIVFRLHHTIMHHLANNGLEDISSTEAYQGDDWYDFAKYWFRFQVLAYLELPYFSLKTGRYMWFAASVLVIGGFLLAMQWLAESTCRWATFCVFGMPWLIDHASDGVRNWCQHTMVAAKSVGSTHFHANCSHTYNIIDEEHNRRTFNEGYHVIHHAWGGRHWTTLPEKFYEEVAKLSTCDQDVWCLTFRHTSIWKVFLHLATPGKLESFVLDHFIHIPTAARPEPPTAGEVVKELRSRCAPITTTNDSTSKPFMRRTHVHQD